MRIRHLLRSGLYGYGFAVVVIVGVLLVSIILRPLFGMNAILLFTIAVLFSAWYGGRGPGLLAAVLAVVAIDFFFRPRVFTIEFTLQDLFDLGIFALAALVTGSLAENQRRAEQALRTREEWLQTTLSSIGDAVIVADLQGKVTFLNPVAETLTGWKLSEALGQDMHAVFHIINQKTRHPVENPVEKVLRKGITVGLANHTVLVAKDGREFPIDDSGAPIRDAAGHVSGAVLIFRDVSERQKTQAAQARLAAIVESSDDAIIGKSLDAIITSWNQGAERMYGYTAQEMIGQPIALLIPPGVPNDVPQILERIKRGERIEHYETQRMRKDGRVLDVSLSVSPIRDEDGNVVGASKIARDITGRKQAEAALTQAVDYYRRLQEQLIALVEASNNLLSTLELDQMLATLLALSRQLVASDAFAVWRKSPDTGEWQAIASTGLSKPYLDQSTRVFGESIPLDKPILAEDIQAAARLVSRKELYRQEGIASIMVIPMRIKDQVAGSLAFYYHERQRFTEVEIQVATALANIASAAVNSAELYQRQSELRVAAEQLQQRTAFLAEASKVLVSSLDFETTLRSVAQLVVPTLADWCTVYLPDTNGNLVQIAAAHQDPQKLALANELQRRYPVKMGSDDVRAQVMRTGEPSIFPEITPEMVSAGEVDDGHLKLNEGLGIKSAMLVPLKARGETLGVIGFATSESSRTYGNSDLALAEELANRAALAVDNSQLYREARDAIRDRDEFLSVAAHELKTPITSLRGFAQTLMRQFDRTGSLEPERIHQALSRLDQQSLRLTKLTNQLLDISRIESGRLILDHAQTDVTALVQEVVARAQAGTEKHNLIFRCDSNPIQAEVDPLRLEQVLTNLLDNAIKYSPEGGPVEIDLHESRGIIRLAVTDHGIGIPVENRDRIFDRFYQAHAGLSVGGMGLGLYISRQIAELHGGKLDAEFLAEGGTRFIVSLPIKPPETASSLESETGAA